MPSNEISVWLDKIFASKYFKRSTRLTRFLRFLVSRTLDGAATELKEYVIGIEVFDRNEDYDPRLDPIVRVEARRLRLKLRQYYEGEGVSDDLTIQIPDRGYAPIFARRKQAIERQDGLSIRRLDAHSVGVVSFALGTDPAANLFATGLGNEILCLLGGKSDINVAARVSTDHFVRKADETGTPLCCSVEFTLEGNVRWESDTIRVCVQLVSSESGFCVWSHAYEQEFIGILEGQKRIAGQIVTDVGCQLAQQPAKTILSKRSNNATADLLYARGRSYLNSRTRDGFYMSVRCFQKLIDTCPDLALGYAGIADAYSLGARYDVFPHREAWKRARLAAVQAVEIDQSLAEAHTSLGFVDLHYYRDWPSAESEFCTAILLNPSYAPARQWYGWYLAATGRNELAVDAVKEAVALDPRSPNANADLALAYYFSRQYAKAIEQCRKTLVLKPGFFRSHQLAGLVHLRTKEFSAAIDELTSAISSSDGNGRSVVLLANAYAAMGSVEDSRRVFARSVEAHQRFSSVDLVLYFAGIGDLDRAFEYLDRAYLDQDAELIWLGVDPIYDGIRMDPRFGAFLEHMTCPPVTTNISGGFEISDSRAVHTDIHSLLNMAETKFLR